MSERFGELRALLHQPADVQSWTRLCELLDGTAADELEQVYLPYLEAHLSRWPDLRRVAPWRWIEGAISKDRASRVKMRIVKVVDMSLRRVQRDVLERVLERAVPEGITHLYLESCRLSPASIALLVSHPKLEALRVLGLARNPLSRDGAGELARAASFVHLDTLDVEGCMLDDAGVEGVLGAPGFSRLEQLDLSANTLGVGAMEALAGCVQARSLRELNLTGCVPKRGARLEQGGPLLDVLMASGERWPELRQLELGRWGFGPQDVESLCGPMCEPLRVLDLNGSALLEAGARALAQCEVLGRLEVLDLGRNRIGDEGAWALVAPGTSLTSLRRVVLPWNGITAAMAARMEQAGCQVVLG